MKDARIWAKRVEAWRASGLTSEKFCEGLEFTAGGLRNAAHLMGKTRRRRQTPRAAARRPASIRLARVVRVPRPAPAGPAPDSVVAGVRVELGGARVDVPPGFDRRTLEAVLDVLAARAPAGGGGR